MKPFARRTDIDWKAVEADYRIGVKSIRMIAEDYGCTEGAIRRRAREGGWVRNEAAVVRTRAHEIVNEKAIPRLIEPDADKVEALATASAEVLGRHRTAVGVMAGLAKRMVEQLTDQTEHEADLGEQIRDFFEAKAAQNPLAAATYRKQMNHALHAISLGARSKTLLNLTGAVEKLQNLERRAWNLEDGADNRTFEDLLAEIEAKRAA